MENLVRCFWPEVSRVLMNRDRYERSDLRALGGSGQSFAREGFE